MAIPNVNEITSQLRMMSDQQLQQYAAMHKADPYILPMAISESNARKQMRSEQQALAAGQPQQKVVDADIAAIAPQPQLPEHQGIGALPAQNMQHMADGGIAGYAGGGMDEQLAYSNEPVMRMAEGGIARFADRGAVRSPYSDDTTSYDPFTGQPVTGEYTTSGNDDRTMLERFGVFNPENRRAIERGEAEARARKAGTPAPTVTPYNDATATRAADYAPTKKLPPPPTARQPGAAPAAPGTPAPSYMDQFEAIAKKNRPDEAQGIAALMAERKKAREEAGVTGEAGEAQKQAFEKEAAQAADDKKEMLWMSLIKGGLAAAGGTSQHAIKNIADGFGIGLDDAAKGMKELKLAEKERNRGLAAIEEARRAEKRGDADTAIAARDKQKDAMANYNMHVMQGQATILGQQIGAGATVESAKIHAAATRDAANRTPAELQLVERYGTDPKFAAAYDKLAVAKREPMTEGAMKAKWASEPYLQTKYPNVQDFITMMASSSTGASQLNPADAALVNKYLR